MPHLIRSATLKPTFFAPYEAVADFTAASVKRIEDHMLLRPIDVRFPYPQGRDLVASLSAGGSPHAATLKRIRVNANLAAALTAAQAKAAELEAKLAALGRERDELPADGKIKSGTNAGPTASIQRKAKAIA
jgi:hypothetical protein